MTEKIGSQKPNQLVREKRKQDVLDDELSRAVAFIIGADPNTCFDNVLVRLEPYPDASCKHNVSFSSLIQAH